MKQDAGMFRRRLSSSRARYFTAIGCLIAVMFSPPRLRAAADRPNFIFINIDDLGYGDIGPFGSTLNRTPQLDQMAAEGRKLTCFYAAPVCSPSRASLMTGCYPKRVLSIPGVLFPANAEGLHPDEVTVAELLKAQGYATGIIGKWHLGDQPMFLPTRQGFDEFFGLPYSNDMGPAADGIKSNLGQPIPDATGRGAGQPPLPLMRNETVLQRVLPDDQQSLVERYTQEAIAFLWRHQDDPFFLYLPHSAVHFPLYPGKAFHGTSSNGLFGDWVEEVDWSVGQILNTVRQLGLEERTLVIFTSDNGGAARHGAVNAPLRGAKGSSFEGGMRVPTIAWRPGHIPAGTTTDAVCGMLDILPTFVSLAGGSIPGDRTIDGGNIWPLLTGAAAAQSPHETFYFFGGLKLRAVRNGPWKLHLENGELYNLDEDIAEAHDVSAAHPEVVARLRQLALEMDVDLGMDGIGPGCRPLGLVDDPQPLIAHDGAVRTGFDRPRMTAGQGIMVGEVTSTSALVQVRLTKDDRLTDGDVPGTEGVVQFVIEPADGVPLSVSQVSVDALPTHDFIARARFTDLSPGVNYIIRTQIGPDAASLRPGPTATFCTLAGAENERATRFVVVTGMNYRLFHGEQPNTRGDGPGPYTGPDKHLGYPAVETIRRLAPDFFVGTGDNVYYDSPKQGRATTLEQMRQRWHEQFVQPRYRDMFAIVPTYWMVDDHDYRIDDCDNAGDYEPSPALGHKVMHEQMPVVAMDEPDGKTYRTHRVSRDLQVWFPENRLHRSPNGTPDGPGKSIWGAEQKAWLMQTLLASDATFKLLISPTPMIGPDDKRKTDNHTNGGGFQHERDEFFAWLNETGLAQRNVYLVCGDRHWQYHSIHPAGIEEFSSGALVDANARLGRLPGDPLSTDPDALIKQPYTQDTPSGGFLLIESVPANAEQSATLTFRFHDERGALLHEHVKHAASLSP
ncbi:MAG: sulfatase-like hydrolase/transferase [Planctomycetaceae bacterium]|nr:sulfatase-like hydrolase/transferase [Planctomycetaceae bacterium]